MSGEEREDIVRKARELFRNCMPMLQEAIARLGAAMEKISPMIADMVWRLTEYSIDPFSGIFQVSNPLVPGVIGFGITPGQAWQDFVRQLDEEAHGG